VVPWPTPASSRALPEPCLWPTLPTRARVRNRPTCGGTSGNPGAGQRGRPTGFGGLAYAVHRLGGEAGHSVGPGVARAAHRGDRRWRAAAASLATSALLGAALTGSRGEQDSSAAELHRLMFAAGRLVHGAGFGALVSVLGLAGLRTGELPQPPAVADLVSAAGLLSPLYFVWEPAAWLIPAGRFPGLLVIGISGVRLHRR